MSRSIDFDDGFTSSNPSTVSGLPASDVANTPSGNLAATNVQSALDELQIDIDSINSNISNVDNTSDINKPVSTAQATAIGVVQTNLSNHESNSTNPHSVTKTQVGLGNVDNTSDASKNSAAATLSNKTIAAGSNTITDLADGNIAAAAGIALSKLATLTASRVPQTNSSTGFLEASNVTNAELNYLSGVSSNIQTQLNGKTGVGAVQSKTANYTILTSDSYVFCDATSGGFTLTFYTAVSNSGKIITVKKTDSSFNIVTLSGTGLTTNYLHTIGETATFISDGTNWIQIDRKTDTPEISITPTFSNFGTVGTPQVTWWRTGSHIQMAGRGVFGTTGGSAATIDIPNSGVWTVAGSHSGKLIGHFTNGSSTSNFGVIQGGGDASIAFSLISGGSGLSAAVGTTLGSSGQVFSFYTEPFQITNFSS